MNVYLGTSGWSYEWWRGPFYPPGLPAGEWLPYYAARFNAVEVNMTFYRFPTAPMIEGWLAKTPPGFRFILKAPKVITHIKRLRDAEHDVHYFYLLAQRLGPKLGGILFQLPPGLAPDDRLLESFLASLPEGITSVFEFRHPGWYGGRTAEILRAAGAVFCAASSERVPNDIVETDGTAYVRFHGLTGGHRFEYPDEEIEAWAGRIARLGSRTVYLFFNNDYRAYAVMNAARMGELLERTERSSQPD
jgi:uncharacterized protein YecE (DUF72 family)